MLNLVPMPNLTPILIAGTPRFAGVGWARTCAFDTDGRLHVLRLGPSATVTTFDPDGRTLAVLDTPGAEVFALHPDGPLVASGNQLGTRDAGETIRAIARGPDGRIAVLTEHRLQIWAGDVRQVDVHAHDRAAWCLDWVGDEIVTGGWDDRVCLWSPDGRLRAEAATNNVRTVCIADGIVYTGGGSGRVRGWRLPDLTPLAWTAHHEFPPGGDAGVQAVCVRGERVYTWANDHAVRCWMAGQLVWRTEAEGHTTGSATRELALGPDCLALAATSGPLTILDLHGKVVHRHTVPIRTTRIVLTDAVGAFDRNGQGQLFRGPEPEPAETDEPGWVAALATRSARVLSGHLELHTGGFQGRISGQPITTAAFAPSGEWLVTLGSGALVWWWLRPVQLQAQLVEAPYFVRAVAVSPDGAFVAFTHEDGVEVHATAGGAKIDTLAHVRPGDLTFVGPRTVLFVAHDGLWRWSFGQTPEQIVRSERPGERDHERDDGWPLTVQDGRAVFLGPDLNLWAVPCEVEASEPASHVAPPGRPRPILWRDTVWCFAGAFGHLEASAAAQRVLALGGAVSKSVTAKCTHVCVGLGGGPAYAVRAPSKAETQARERGLPVLTEADFLVAASPSADELRTWSAAQLTTWRRARPARGLLHPLEVPALHSIQWPGAQLAGAELSHADLRGANLDGADLSDIEGERLDLRGASLRNAMFQGARLFAARFEGADLTGVTGLRK